VAPAFIGKAALGRTRRPPRNSAGPAAQASGLLLQAATIESPLCGAAMPVDELERVAGQEKFVGVLFWFFWLLFGVIIVVDLILALMH
jgi:hypothetical protein